MPGPGRTGRTGRSGPVLVTLFVTKSAQFSQNGYSEEIFKLTQKVAASQDIEKDGHVVAGSAVQTNRFGIEEPSRLPSPNSHLKEPSVPPGFDRQILEGSDETPLPPGFEAFKSIESNPSLKAKALKSHHELSGKRVTRSQSKKVTVSTERIWKNLSSFSSCNGSRENSPQSRKSSKTTYSEAKLAMESLEIGKLLGVKVIAMEDSTLKRITSSLKRERKARASQKTK